MSIQYVVTVTYKRLGNGEMVWLATSLGKNSFVGATPELAVGRLFQTVNAAIQHIPQHQLCLANTVEELGAHVMRYQENFDIRILLLGESKDGR